MRERRGEFYQPTIATDNLLKCLCFGWWGRALSVCPLRIVFSVSSFIIVNCLQNPPPRPLMERETCLVGELMWTLLLMWWTLSFNCFNLYSCAFLGSLIGVEQNRPINGILYILCSSFSPSKTNKQTNKLEQGGVSHCGLAIYIKTYLKAKEELSKLKYFTMPKYNLQQIL